ncbi:MAG: hypothetical protein ABH832_03490 [bacterium]
MSTSRPIEITKDELRKIIYFILMKFRSDSLHMQGTSAKRDLIGGYIERWFNKIAETVIFDYLLKDENYNVVSDYFLYANDSDKNAPDILGLEKKDGSNMPFVKYNNGTWSTCKGMPRIEVKVVRKDQYLAGVREPQMIDDYYVFIESELEGDYLSAIFEDEVFDNKYLHELDVSSDFIESDKDSQLIKHEEMSKADRVGTMRLIGIYTKDELRKLSVKCGKGVKPWYFANAVNKSIRGVGEESELNVVDGICNYSFEGEIYLPFHADGLKSNPKIVKRNKGSVYLDVMSKASFGGIEVEPGRVKIEFKKFDRSSSWDENMVLKSYLEEKGKDSTDELLTLFGKLINN